MGRRRGRAWRWALMAFARWCARTLAAETTPSSRVPLVFRGLVPREQLPSLPDPRAIQFWVGNGAHIPHCGIGNNAEFINILGVVEGPQHWPNHTCPTTNAGGRMCSARTFLVGLPIGIRQQSSCVGLWHNERVGDCSLPVLSAHWSKGPIVLIGDAAHGMFPHQGQGANQTIEDAVTLAAMIANPPAESIVESLIVFENPRKSRTRRVQKYSWRANRPLHLSDGPAVHQRDSRLHSLPEAIGWIHEHDAELQLPAKFSSSKV